MVGRQEEIKKIQQLLSSNKAQFLAVTGRRRVGKTFLVDSTLRAHYCFSMTGIQNGDTATQLVNFSVKLAEYKGDATVQTPRNWQEAFLHLKNYLKTLDSTKKQVVFIDELPWVNAPRSGFVQLLAHFWNDYLSKEPHFLLVICGSATSWISKNIINDPGGLHNRVTEIIHLRPFTIAETKSFLANNGLSLSNLELAKTYMALGGVPFYLETLRKGESFPVGIERICFSPNGILKNEYHNLYQALFNNSSLHQAIVAALAERPKGLSNKDILSITGRQPTGSYRRALQELILSDFVLECTPFQRKKRDSVYRLVDEYSVFYHHFIKGNRKYTPGIWQQLAASQSYKTWAGYAFENLCHKHIESIKKALNIAAVYAEISSLYIPGSAKQEGFQIDLLIDRKDDCINLCEIKFHSGPYILDKSEYQRLLEKKQRFLAYTGTRKQVFLTMITNFSLARNQYSDEIVDVALSLDQLLEN